MKKVCTRCKKSFPVAAFIKQAGGAKDGLHSYCNACRRDNSLLRTYGITHDEYLAIAASQDNRCAVCRVEAPLRGRSGLYVDHNHKTKQVRGLLCSKCNSALGFVDENPEIVVALLSYIQLHNIP